MTAPKTKTIRGTARALRRAKQDYSPVNPVASVLQHPEGRFSKSLTTEKRNKLYAGVTADTE